MKLHQYFWFELMKSETFMGVRLLHFRVILFPHPLSLIFQFPATLYMTDNNWWVLNTRKTHLNHTCISVRFYNDISISVEREKERYLT